MYKRQGDGDPTNDDTDGDGTPDYLEVNDPELTLTKTSNATGNEVAGQTIIYTFSVENTGNVSVSSITVDDVLTGSTDLAISPGSLAPGETGTATANYIVSQADVDNGSIVNSASVEGTAIGNVTVSDISDNGDELVDDDNDGVLTKDEGGADGDPINDFNDPNNPTLPDYLNPDVTSN